MKRIFEIAIGGFLGAVLLWYFAFRIFPPLPANIPKKEISIQPQQPQIPTNSQSIIMTQSSSASPTKNLEKSKEPQEQFKKTNNKEDKAKKQFNYY